jgi:hypothetical protein
MRGSAAATFVLLFAGLAGAAILWAVSHVNRQSHKTAQAAALLAEVSEVAELNAYNARLEGENTRLRAENVTLKDLATGRKDIQDLTQEIRTMVWMAYGPNEEASHGRRPRPLRQPGSE